MFRGTLRYPGWSVMMKGLVDLGWVELSPPPRSAKTYGEVTASLAQVPGLAGDSSALRAAVATFLSLEPESNAIERMEWVGLFSDRPIPEADTVLDVIGELLMEKLAYGDGERDMIVLLHEFVAKLEDGRRQQVTSTLVDYGIPNGDSAMARTVSLPAAIAARLVLEGEIQVTGVRIPVMPEIYNPVLDELSRLGIECRESFGEPTD